MLTLSGEKPQIFTAKMVKRVGFYGLVGFGSLCLIFLIYNQKYTSNPWEHRLQPILSAGRTWEEMEARVRLNDVQEQIAIAIKNVNDLTSSLNEMKHVIDMQRRMIQNDMATYEYPRGKYYMNASKLEDLVPEKNGRPIRSIILTTWRSGSTFFGDVLNAHPANYYHYEPLLNFDIVQIRDSPLAEKAIAVVKTLLNCNYTNLEEYIEYGKDHPWLFNHNTHLWRQCQGHRGLCYNHKFLSAFCKLFPFQSMKLVRLRLRLAEELLADEELGVRVVLLVRDPRGTLQSRQHRDWCPRSPDCSDPVVLCDDLVSDYYSAIELQRKYPTKFRVIRYEDLAVRPYKNVKELLEFYGLDFHPNIKRFLDTHTKNDAGGVSSTFRNSKATPFHWRQDFNFETVDQIQRSCEAAMKRWGYVPAMNASHQREFNPTTDYKLRL